MCKLSFIIPVYNTSQYITKCIDSILNQEIHNYEIIIVNDGSTDNSLQVLQKYIEYQQITIISKPNGGVSSARNKGIEICKGDYIFFVDSDDYIESHSLINILNILQKEKPDLLRFSSNIIVGNNKKTESTKLNGYKSTDKLYNSSRFYPVLWGYIFKTNIIKNYRLFFNESLKYSEDSNFIFKYLNYTNKIYFSNHITYNYIVRNDSAIHQKFTQSWAESNLIALIDVLKWKKDTKHINFVINYYLKAYFTMIFKAKLIQSDDIRKSYKKFFSLIYQSSEGNLTALAKLSKISFTLSCFTSCLIFYYYRFKSRYLN